MRRTDGWRCRAVKIVTLEQLKQMPVGTMYVPLDCDTPTLPPVSVPQIITCSLSFGFNGTLPVFPDIYEVGNELYSNYCTYDTADIDYDKNQRFFVFSKQDIKGMIRCLVYAITDGATSCDFEEYWNEDGTEYKTDEEMEAYID